MKICFILTGLGVGGAEKQVCDLADMHKCNGHDVIIISLTGDAIVKPNNPDVRVFSMHMLKNPLSSLKKYFEVRKIISDFSPDIVHSHMLHANIFGRLLRLTTRFKVLVSTAHNTYEGGPLWMFLYRVTDCLATISTNVSQASVDAFIKSKASNKNKMIPFYNGIDCEKFTFSAKDRYDYREKLGLKDNQKLILSVGRLTAAKNQELLLTSFKKLLAKDPNLKLVIVGDGPEKGNLESFARNIGISDALLLPGNSFNVAQWMSAADVFTLSSKWEGMPLVICEAMSMERLVVSTDCGGIREIIDQCGFLAEIDNEEQYTNALSRAIYLDDSEKSTLGNDARLRIINNFSLRRITEKWLMLYESLLRS